MATLRLSLRAVLYKEDGRWVAHCLEFDLAGDGETPEEAIECLQNAIDLQIEFSREHQNLRNLFRPADGEYFRMWAAGKDIAVGQRKISAAGRSEIELTETREYSDDDLLCV